MRSTKRQRRARRAIVGGLVAVLAMFVPASASAHPLGNFSINRLHTLTFTNDVVIDDVLVDSAEIPTAQASTAVDADGDGTASDAEREQYASSECEAIRTGISLTVDGASAPFAVISSSFVYEAGEAGLDTSRLSCHLQAPIADSSGDAGQRIISFEDSERTGRVGWNEINAVGDGVGIIDSPVPTSSVTNGLRTYPIDLLESPLDVRAATFTVDPSASGNADELDIGATPVDGDSGAAAARDDLVDSRPGFFDGTLGRVQDKFDEFVGGTDLTIGVGFLAIGLAIVLGASHAMLPGHGKTVMAAYIAGRQGSTRDAVIVGATVTATHTGGVLLLGLALTVSSSLAGESVLAYLGVASGLLIAALGLGLLVSAIRHRDDGFFGHGHSHGPGGHSHGPHGHSHDDHVHDDHVHDDHAHDDHDSFQHTPAPMRRPAGDVAVLEPATDLAHNHHQNDEHAHDHGEHTHDHHDHHTHDQPKVSRRGLVGMGIAGGLVPSPSALIILLSAIALGRTWFGILLVVAYGIGMAGTLTLAGIFLVKVRDRYQGRAGSGTGKLAAFGRAWSNLMPYITAALVFVVGMGLAIRGLADI